MAEKVAYGADFRKDIPTGLEVVQRFRKQVDGKVFVLTGTSDGSIGAEASKVLASGAAPAQLYLLAR